MSSADFWTRRRAAVAQADQAEAAAAEAAALAERNAALDAQDDEAILAELGLPEPEALDSAEAVRAFLQSAVPQRLKTRALRRLWRLNPALANLDGLVDYGGDFTDKATVIDNLQTAYQVGKGMLRHVEALAAKEAAPTPEDEDEADIAEPEEVVKPRVDGMGTDLAAGPVSLTEQDESPSAEEDFPVAPAPRRMTFAFPATSEVG